MKVLHVVESFGGGVASAIDHYRRAVPEASHHLLRRVRDTDFIEDGETDGFDSISELIGVGPAGARQLRRCVSALAPDVVHAHSSLAGALVRIAIRAGRTPRVVYTPHCFAFERQDTPAVVRFAFKAAERILILNTDVVAACSPHELSLAKSLRRGAIAIWVPNVAGTDAVPVARTGGDVALVCAMGRLGAQKDPDFFRRCIQAIPASSGDIEAIWLGGGPADVEKALLSADIQVTGWLPHSQAIHQLRRSTVYLHTAAWEGAPVAMLEANALGVPILARRISSLAQAPPEFLFDDPEEMAGAIATLLRDETKWGQNVERWSAWFSSNTTECQRRELLRAYRSPLPTLATRAG